MTGPRPNPLSEIAQESLCAEAPFTATVQELHLVALHVLCAAMDAELGVGAADDATTGSAVGR
jgi:D-sedoheptulose 7-phosphate isomerase